MLSSRLPPFNLELCVRCCAAAYGRRGLSALTRVQPFRLSGMSRTQACRCLFIDHKSFRIDDYAVALGSGFHRHVALAHVIAHILGRPLERRAITAATAGADAEGIAFLELRNENLCVRKI